MKNNCEIKVFIGQEALLLSSNLEFLASWDALYNACSWATIFQSSSFVITWYNIYQSEYLPIIIKAEQNGSLLGLLTVAKDKKKVIIGAGADQAEYQVWLAANSHGESFIIEALQSLHKYFPESEVRLQYINNKTPLNWITAQSFEGKQCFLQTTKHYFVRINQDYILNKLKNPGRRNKINKLKRLGDLKFERITDAEIFDSKFNQLSLLSDFRKGAMFNKFYFRADPFRKQFLLALLELNILHVSVLMLNDDIIASNVGMIGVGGKIMYSGINSHAPTYAKNSPGILHFLFLSKQLAEEGVAMLDLGPGDNFYKEELGSDYTVGYTLYFRSALKTIADKIKYSLIKRAKNIASRIGVKPIFLRRIKTDAEIVGMGAIIIGWIKNALRKQPTRKFKINTTNIQSSNYPINIKKDSLQDLLAYESDSKKGLSRWKFLSEAKTRLESEEHCFTWVSNDLLLGCVWVKDLKLFEKEGSNSNNGLLHNSIVLEGLYCHSSAFKKINDFILTVAVISGDDEVYLVTKGQAYYQALNTAGFEPLAK